MLLSMRCVAFSIRLCTRLRLLKEQITRSGERRKESSKAFRFVGFVAVRVSMSGGFRPRRCLPVPVRQAEPARSGRIFAIPKCLKS